MAEWPKIIQESYTAWDMMRQLGFAAADLFFITDSTGHAAISLYRGGKKTEAAPDFTILVGDSGVEPSMLLTLWRRFIEELKSNKITDAELKAFYMNSEMRTKAVDLIVALHNKGIHIPKEIN